MESGATRFRWWGMGAGMMLLLVLSWGSSHADVVVTLQTGVPAAPGATSEVAVSLDWTEDTPPSTLILGIGYDRSKVTPDITWFESITAGKAGSEVTRMPVNLAKQAVDAGKTADFNVIDAVDAPAGEGVLLVAVTGGKNTIPKGAFLTLALRAAANLYGATTLRGLDTDHPAFYGTNPPMISSAADAAGNALPVVVQQGSLVVNGCVAAAGPTDVRTTTDRSDGVLVRWTAETGLEYRVFRQSGGDSEPMPLGSGWIQGSEYLDKSAPYPSRAGGCLSTAFTPVVSKYWVVARDRVAPCPALPSGEGVEGYRAGGSIFSIVFGCQKRALFPRGVEPPVVLAAPVLLLLARRKK